MTSSNAAVKSQFYQEDLSIIKYSDKLAAGGMGIKLNGTEWSKWKSQYDLQDALLLLQTEIL